MLLLPTIILTLSFGVVIAFADFSASPLMSSLRVSKRRRPQTMTIGRWNSNSTAMKLNLYEKRSEQIRYGFKIIIWDWKKGANQNGLRQLPSIFLNWLWTVINRAATHTRRLNKTTTAKERKIIEVNKYKGDDGVIVCSAKGQQQAPLSNQTTIARGVIKSFFPLPLMWWRSWFQLITRSSFAKWWQSNMKQGLDKD